MGGQFAYPADPSRLQGGLCANPRIISPRAWDLLTDGPEDPSRVPVADLQLRWNDAKQICRACQILTACEAQAMDHKIGVWGGTDQHERYNRRKAGYRKTAKEKVKQAKKEPVAALQAAPSVMEKRAFPVEDPPGFDGWVRIRQAVRSAFYMAQTADGTYTKVKLKGDKAPMIKWIPSSDMDLRRSVPVQIQEWAGRPGRKDGHGVQAPVADAA